MNKILIACPTSSHKDYCLEEWAKKIMTIAHNYDPSGKHIGILIIDNSKDKEHWSKIYTMFFHEKCKHDNFECFLGVRSHYVEGMPLRNLMAACNNIISSFVIKNNVDYLMSIESDIFPPDNIIQHLLDKKPSKNKVVAAPYFLFTASYSKNIYFDIEDFGNERLCIPVDPDRIYDLIDGDLHSAQQLGLGCAIIHKNILKSIPFRIDESDKINTHADSFFYEDCRNNGISLLFDTSCTCVHKNGSWFKINNLK